MEGSFGRYQKEIEFALESVSLAAGVVKDVRAEMGQAAFTKKDDSPVTVADFAAQALAAKKLQECFPGDPLVGEENAQELRQNNGQPILQRVIQFLTPYIGRHSGEAVCDWIDHGNQEPSKRFWTMDPIDGTKGFIRGDQYAVALALIEEGDIKVSVMACPNLKNGQTPDLGGEGTLACAVRGEGAFVSPLTGPMKWRRLKVSSCDRTEEAVLLRSFEKGHTDASRTQSLSQSLGILQPPLLMDSLAKYVVLASGRADLLLRFPTEAHPHEWIWDQASGVLIIEEAGGRVSDLDGKPLDFTRGRQLKANRGVLLSNGPLHAPVIEVLKTMNFSPR